MGEGVDAQVTLLVKPVSAPLATNLVVTTDRRLYQVELLAEPGDEAAYQSLVVWHYPGGAVVPGLPRVSGAATGVAAGPELPASDTPVIANVRELDFDFSVKPASRGGLPAGHRVASSTTGARRTSSSRRTCSRPRLRRCSCGGPGAGTTSW